jgi:hypothetical protein
VCVYVAVASKKKEREREIRNTTVLVLVLQSLSVGFFAFLVSERRIVTIALLVSFVLLVSKSSSVSREEGEVAGDDCVTERPTDNYSSRHKKSSSFEDFVCSFAAF